MVKDAIAGRLAAGAAALIVAGCAAKLVVTRVPPGALPGGELLTPDGVFYALPRTVVRVDLPVERIETEAGRHAEYARLFFPHLAEEALARKARVEQATTAAGATGSLVSFRLGTPAFSAAGEPDPEHVYFVKIAGGLAADRTALVEYTDQGALLGVQAEASQVGAEVLSSTVGAVSGIVARAVLARGAPVKAMEKKCAIRPREDLDPTVWGFFAEHARASSAQPAPEAFDRYCDLDEAEREEIAKAARERAPGLLRAYGAFQRILDLSYERRPQLMRQTLAPEVVLRDLDAAVARELAAFAGSEARDAWTGSFEVLPARIEDRITILRFSAHGGVCETADLRGKPSPPPRFTRKEACGDSRAVEVRFRLDGQDQLFSRVAARYVVGEDLETAGDRGFRYRLPALTRVEVAGAGDPAARLGEARAAIAQFGRVLSLPASSGGRSLNYDLKFYEATGALKSFRLASKSAIQKGVVDSLGSSTTALLDARLKREREEAAEADLLNQLERRRRILEEQVKIRKACAELGLDCREP